MGTEYSDNTFKGTFYNTFPVNLILHGQMKSQIVHTKGAPI